MILILHFAAIGLPCKLHLPVKSLEYTALFSFIEPARRLLRSVFLKTDLRSLRLSIMNNIVRLLFTLLVGSASIIIGLFSHQIIRNMKAIISLLYNKISSIGIMILGALPIILGFVFISLFGINVPFWDEWTFIEMLNQRTFGIADLLKQHNEHRIFFPKILVLLYTEFVNDYNSMTLMYIVLLELIFTLLIIYLVAKAQFRFTFPTFPLWFVPIPFLLLSWRQIENLLWGFQLSFVMPLPFGLLACYYLWRSSGGCDPISKRPDAYFMGAVVAATIASFSTSMGLLVWISGLLAISISGKPGKKIIYSGVWGIIGVVEWWIYFTAYQQPANHPDIFYGIAHPFKFSRYFCSLLGGGFVVGQPQQDYAFMVGLLVFGWYCFSVWSVYALRALSRNVFWLSCSSYLLLILFSIAVGRSGFGIAQAFASRYTSYSLPFATLVYIMLISLAQQGNSNYSRLFVGGMLGICLVTTCGMYLDYWKIGEIAKTEKEEMLASLLCYENASDAELQRLYPSAQGVRQSATFLKRHQYSSFNPAYLKSKYPNPLKYLQRLPEITTLTAINLESLSWIDAIDDVLSSTTDAIILAKNTNDVIIVSGWAVDKSRKTSAGGVYLEIDGQYFPARYGIDRPDVALHFNLPAYQYSGFQALIPVEKIGLGEHRLSMKILTHDQTAYYTSPQTVRFKITSP